MTFAMNPPNTRLTDKNGYPEPEWYRFFANLQRVVGATDNPLDVGSFLTLSAASGLSAERVFTPSPGQLTGADGGANSTYTLSLANTAVTPNPYGGATKTVSFTVDAKGRLIAAAEFALSTTNIAEGTNLYYTDARARAAFSATAPLSYNSGTGAFSVTSAALTRTDDTNVTLALGGTPGSALLAATSLTLGWTGTLAVARGGTGAGSFTDDYLIKGNATAAFSSSLVYDNGTAVSIGGTSPSSLLHVDNGFITTSRYGSSGSFVGQRAEGSLASPTQVVSSVNCMTLFGKGYDGSNYQTIAVIIAISDGTITSASSPGALSFQTVPSGAVNQVERMRITSAGNIYPTSGTTGMTDGFFYIPAAAGVPSGVPTAITGRVPMYYDTTNNDFYVYNGAWKKVALA